MNTWKENMQDNIGCFDRLRAKFYNQDNLSCIFAKTKSISCQFLYLFGNLRSADVLRSLYKVLCELFLIKLRKYGGASSFKLLKTIIIDSMSIKSLAVFHPSFSIN